MTALHGLTLQEATACLPPRGKLREITQACLERICQVEPKITLSSPSQKSCLGAGS